MWDAIKSIGGSVVFLLVILAFTGQLAEVIQAMWGGKVRMLKAENKRLREELRQYRELHGVGATQQLRARVESLETIVTDDAYELDKKLRKL